MRKTPLERVRDKFDVAETGCWLWTGHKSRQGYGRTHVYVDDKRQHALAHRLMYELRVGPIPEGLTLDHLCDNPPCVNPEHLRPVTQRENLMRSGSALAALNARKTHCVNGHEFTKENTYTYGPGRRQGNRKCRKCESDRLKRKRQGK